MQAVSNAQLRAGLLAPPWPWEGGALMVFALILFSHVAFLSRLYYQVVRTRVSCGHTSKVLYYNTNRAEQTCLPKLYSELLYRDALHPSSQLKIPFLGVRFKSMDQCLLSSFLLTCLPTVGRDQILHLLLAPCSHLVILTPSYLPELIPPGSLFSNWERSQ